MTANNHILDLVNINAYIKFDEILSICFQGIEILTSIKGHHSVTNLRKKTANIPNLDLVNIIVILSLVKPCPFVLKILSGNKILT